MGIMSPQVEAEVSQQIRDELVDSLIKLRKTGGREGLKDALDRSIPMFESIGAHQKQIVELYARSGIEAVEKLLAEEEKKAVAEEEGGDPKRAGERGRMDGARDSDMKKKINKRLDEIERAVEKYLKGIQDEMKYSGNSAMLLFSEYLDDIAGEAGVDASDVDEDLFQRAAMKAGKRFDSGGTINDLVNVVDEMMKTAYAVGVLNEIDDVLYGIREAAPKLRIQFKY